MQLILSTGPRKHPSKRGNHKTGASDSGQKLSEAGPSASPGVGDRTNSDYLYTIVCYAILYYTVLYDHNNDNDNIVGLLFVKIILSTPHPQRSCKMSTPGCSPPFRLGWRSR